MGTFHTIVVAHYTVFRTVPLGFFNHLFATINFLDCYFRELSAFAPILLGVVSIRHEPAMIVVPATACY
jgi:hypothetical protein